MANANRLGYRLTTLALGGQLMPVPAVAWIVFLWCGDRPTTIGAWVRRILGTLALVVVGLAGFTWGLVLADFPD